MLSYFLTYGSIIYVKYRKIYGLICANFSVGIMLFHIELLKSFYCVQSNVLFNLTVLVFLNRHWLDEIRTFQMRQ